jgi:hypothetical protein
VAGYQTACARGCPDVVSGYQTASLSKGRANLQQQQQQSKMYTRGDLQALAGNKSNFTMLTALQYFASLDWHFASLDWHFASLDFYFASLDLHFEWQFTKLHERSLTCV